MSASSDTPPLAYQWQYNGTDRSGATNATLTVEATTNNIGKYSVIVSNELGAVTIGAASLELQPPASPQGEPLLPPWGVAGLLLGVVTVGIRFLNRTTADMGG
jgi:hypothetical protein